MALPTNIFTQNIFNTKISRFMVCFFPCIEEKYVCVFHVMYAYIIYIYTVHVTCKMLCLKYCAVEVVPSDGSGDFASGCG